MPARAALQQWILCGKQVPRGEVVFFSQIIIIYIVILSSLINLSFGIGNQSFFICLISSCLGYLLPAPNLPVKKFSATNNQSPEVSVNNFDFDDSGARSSRIAHTQPT